MQPLRVPRVCRRQVGRAAEPTNAATVNAADAAASAADEGAEATAAVVAPQPPPQIRERRRRALRADNEAVEAAIRRHRVRRDLAALRRFALPLW